MLGLHQISLTPKSIFASTISGSKPFIPVMRTTVSSEPVDLPTGGTGTNHFQVNWGDGTIETVNAPAADVSHTYAVAGDYDIKITPLSEGGIANFKFQNLGDKSKLIDIKKWGSNLWKTDSLSRAFHGCNNFSSYTATDIPLFSSGMDLTSLFRASDFNGNIENWDWEKVVDLTATFFQSSFNQPMNEADVTNVTSMASTFRDCPFNQDISNWQPISCSNFILFLQNNTAFSTANMDALLIAWDGLDLVDGLTFDAPQTSYTTAVSGAAKTNIETDDNWTFNLGPAV